MKFDTNFDIHIFLIRLIQWNLKQIYMYDNNIMIFKPWYTLKPRYCCNLILNLKSLQ